MLLGNLTPDHQHAHLATSPARSPAGSACSAATRARSRADHRKAQHVHGQIPLMCRRSAAVQPAPRVAYNVRPGPKAIATTGSPGANCRVSEHSLHDEQHGRRRAVADVSQHRRTTAPPSAAGRSSCSATTSTMRRPPGWIAQPATSSTTRPWRDSRSSMTGRTCRARTSGHLRRQAHPEAEVGDVPGHVVDRSRRRCGR